MNGASWAWVSRLLPLSRHRSLPHRLTPPPPHPPTASLPHRLTPSPPHPPPPHLSSHHPVGNFQGKVTIHPQRCYPYSYDYVGEKISGLLRAKPTNTPPKMSGGSGFCGCLVVRTSNTTACSFVFCALRLSLPQLPWRPSTPAQRPKGVPVPIYLLIY